MEKYGWILIGVIIGWITKVPLLIKWYCELKQTKDYKEMKLIDRYNKLNPDNPYIKK